MVETWLIDVEEMFLQLCSVVVTEDMERWKRKRRSFRCRSRDSFMIIAYSRKDSHSLFVK